MTRSVEIPEAAVLAAANVLGGENPSVLQLDASRIALAAALPYLTPAQMTQERVAEELYLARWNYSQTARDAWPDIDRRNWYAMAAAMNSLFVAAPAEDGGLREALESRKATLLDWVADWPTNKEYEAWTEEIEFIDRTLSAHPAAPAVPQPATLPTCVNCESETFQCSACGSLVEPWESAAPQPVNREALIMALSPIIGLLVRATNPVSLAQRERMTELNAGKAVDAVLAVLAGEQEQARG